MLLVLKSGLPNHYHWKKSYLCVRNGRFGIYNKRTKEIAFLREIQGMATDNAQFTVVTGRRRIGKTSLVWKAYEDTPILYFFVARKAEGDLCEDYQSEIENRLGIPTKGRGNIQLRSATSQ